MGQLPRGGLDIASAHEVSLYRAVDPREAQDIEEFGGFRLHSSFGYEGGKWFAARFEDAVRWGRAMQRFPRPQPFWVVAVTLPAALLGGLEFHARWDAIGPAYYVSSDQLTMLNRVGVVSILDPVYDVEGSQ